MVDHNPAMIEVEVAYAMPRAQNVVTLNVPAGTTVREALIRSGIVAQTSGWDWDTVVVGIFGKRASLATMLHEHDRVEIYRPLIADPKQARRRRARLRGDNQP